MTHETDHIAARDRMARLLEIDHPDALVRQRGSVLAALLLTLNVLNIGFALLVLPFIDLETNAGLFVLIIQFVYVFGYILVRRGHVDAVASTTVFILIAVTLADPLRLQLQTVVLSLLTLPIMLAGLLLRPRFVVIAYILVIAPLMQLHLAGVPGLPGEVLPRYFIPLLILLVTMLGALSLLTSSLQARLLRGQMALSEELRQFGERELELRLMAEEVSITKSRFLATMSHELRTPLNAILGYTELLREDLEEGAPVEAMHLEDLENVFEAGHMLLELVSGVLDLSKIEAGRMTLHPERFEIRELLEQLADAIEPMARKRDNTVELEFDPHAAHEIVTDRMRLKQILLNLLSNAAKFTQSGDLGMRLRHAEAGIELDVWDTGIGMDEETLARAFEEFVQGDTTTTREYGGTGLGLTIVERMVTLLQGELRATSAPGRGSTFTVWLPLEIVLDEGEGDRDAPDLQD